ncbi:MAG: ferric reductase-like transmembrane domain-containing protein [SAR324 cluster bacterium]|nr:ferric reductase-like transmembrane domain-containing protein [SAR324 cluster bacterium]
MKELTNILSREKWEVFYLLSMLSTLVIGLTAALQPFFLADVIVIPFEEEGTINAHLVVVTQMCSLGLNFLLGFAWSRRKRMASLFYGFVIAAIAALMIPFSKNIALTIGISGLTFFYMMRILVSMGADTLQLQLSTMGGDGTPDRKHPELLSNMIFMMILGSTIILAILMQIPSSVKNIELVMLLPFYVAVFGAFIVNNYMLSDSNEDESVPQPFKQAWDLLSSDPRMQLCFASALYVRADMLAISVFLSLWTNSFADIVGISHAAAAGQAGLMLGYLGLIILITMPLWRKYMDTHSRISAIGASLSITGIGFILLAMMVTNPFDWWTTLLPLTLVGIGQAGSLIGPKILAAELTPTHVLGSLQGLLYLISSMGVVMLVQSGGYYFDAVGPTAPFMLIGASNMLIMFYAFWLVKSGMDERDDHTLIKRRKINLKPFVFMLSLLPLIWLIGRVLVGGVTLGSDIGQMPVGFINRYLGDWAFNFLLLSLSLRPVAKLTKVGAIMQYSRMIGLYAFFYAFLHVLTYWSLEWVFNLNEIFTDIVERPFILLGVAAFIILVVLAVTSTKGWMKKLGGKKWKKLHKTVYLVNILVAFHFMFAATHENGEPLIYGFAVALLLGYRWWKRPQKNVKTVN